MVVNNLFGYVRKAWFENVKGLNAKNRPMIALDVDEPLWHLSKYGCLKRNKITGSCPVFENCELRKFCVNGKIKMQNNRAEVDK